MKLKELGKGQIFGEMALIDAAPRSATAIALEDGTQVTEVSVDELNSYFENNPASGRVMQKAGMHKIEKTEVIVYRNEEHQCVFYEISR